MDRGFLSGLYMVHLHRKSSLCQSRQNPFTMNSASCFPFKTKRNVYAIKTDWLKKIHVWQKLKFICSSSNDWGTLGSCKTRQNHFPPRPPQNIFWGEKRRWISQPSAARPPPHRSAGEPGQLPQALINLLKQAAKSIWQPMKGSLEARRGGSREGWDAVTWNSVFSRISPCLPNVKGWDRRRGLWSFSYKLVVTRMLQCVYVCVCEFLFVYMRMSFESWAWKHLFKLVEKKGLSDWRLNPFDMKSKIG